MATDVAEPLAPAGVARGPAGGIAMADWEQAASLVQASRQILLVSHGKPDGDAIGSLLGLGQALEAAGKPVTLACADPAEGNLARLPGAERIVTDLAPLYHGEGEVPWDLIICLDASDLSRLGNLYDDNRALFERLPVIDLDHHVTNEGFGTVNLVDPLAASTTEVATLLLGRLGITPSAAAATCLLAGLMTDSLSFQTESTTARTLRVAASLVDAGAPIARLAYQLFRQRPRGVALLWSKALATLRFAAGGRLAWIEVTREMVEASGPDAESAGLSGFAGSIAGVDVGMCLEEGEDGNVYVGFRSQSVDVAQLAAQFGGGGHKRASGCRFPAPATLADARAQLLPAVESLLAGAAGAPNTP